MLMDTIKMLTGASVVQQDGSTKYVGAAIYDLAGQTLTQPTNSAVLFRFSVNRAFTLPAGLTGSNAESETAPTGSVSYTIKKNGASIGSIDFASSQNDATFTFSTQQSFVVDDILTIEAPVSADSTHDKIAWTLAATLS